MPRQPRLRLKPAKQHVLSANRCGGYDDGTFREWKGKNTLCTHAPPPALMRLEQARRLCFREVRQPSLEPSHYQSYRVPSFPSSVLSYINESACRDNAASRCSSSAGKKPSAIGASAKSPNADRISKTE